MQTTFFPYEALSHKGLPLVLYIVKSLIVLFTPKIEGFTPLVE